MKHLTTATITVTLSLALAGCGSDNKASPPKGPTSTSTSTSTATTTTSVTSATPGAQAHKTIADYITENHITEIPVHRGDPGSPTIDLAVPPGWRVADESASSYGSIVLAQPANPSDPAMISALVSKLTGDVDPAKILQYAPGELQNLPGYDGFGEGSASTLSGFQAWQLGGTYMKGATSRTIMQKTVVIPGQGAVFVLQLNAESPDSDAGALMEATNVIDKQTKITV